MAPATPTMAVMSHSRAWIAACESQPPTSVTMPRARGKTGVQADP
jgi:hypothetical protein